MGIGHGGNFGKGVIRARSTLSGNSWPPPCPGAGDNRPASQPQQPILSSTSASTWPFHIYRKRLTASSEPVQPSTLRARHLHHSQNPDPHRHHHRPVCLVFVFSQQPPNRACHLATPLVPAKEEEDSSPPNPGTPTDHALYPTAHVPASTPTHPPNPHRQARPRLPTATPPPSTTTPRHSPLRLRPPPTNFHVPTVHNNTPIASRPSCTPLPPSKKLLSA